VLNADVQHPLDVAGVKFEGSASDDSMDDAHMFGNQHAHRGVLPCASPYCNACTIMHNRDIKAALVCIHSCPAGMSLTCFFCEQLHTVSFMTLTLAITDVKRLRVSSPDEQVLVQRLTK